MRWDAPLAQAVRAASQGPRADLVAPGSPPQRRFAGRVVVGPPSETSRASFATTGSRAAASAAASTLGSTALTVVPLRSAAMRTGTCSRERPRFISPCRPAAVPCVPARARLGEDRRRCAFPLLRATRYAIAQGVQPSPAPGLIHALSHVSLRARDSCSGWRARTIRCHWLTAGASSGARRRTGGLHFDGVGVDTVSTVVAEAHERFPLVVEIAHRLAQRARRRHLGYGAVEPSAYRVEHPDALGLLGPPNPYPQCRPNRTFTGSARPLLPGWTNADM